MFPPLPWDGGKLKAAACDRSTGSVPDDLELARLREAAERLELVEAQLASLKRSFQERLGIFPGPDSLLFGVVIRSPSHDSGYSCGEVQSKQGVNKVTSHLDSALLLS